MQAIILKERTLKHKGEDFILGTADGIRLNAKKQLELQANCLEGNYVSPEINSGKFRDLVASWNAEAPEGTNVEVLFQVRKEGRWSAWLSYGKWSDDSSRGSIKGQKDDIAAMDIDTVQILGGNEANGLRYKIIIRRTGLELLSPKFKAISAALSLTQDAAYELCENKVWLRDIEVPQRSQMVIPKIGNIICSPTSLSMVMDYYGVKIATEEVAAGVHDSGANIYGNWSYNVAYAGSKGFYAYIERYSCADGIREKIAAGMPVVASIRTKTEEDIKGAPQAYPGGHLIVIRGFTTKDGEEYVIVNDPAAPEGKPIRREYKVSEFEKAWGGVVYILKPDFQ